MKHFVLGRLGEAVAEQYYLANGYWLLTKNFRAPRGEIDLVLQDKEGVLFVEVKTRTKDWAENLWGSHWSRKRLHMLSAIRYFFYRNPYLHDQDWSTQIAVVTQGRVSEVFAGPW